MSNKVSFNKNKKDFIYANKTQTSILFEEPSDINPYVNKAKYLYGYNLIELIEKKSFIDTLLLIFKGELPSKSESKLLECLMIALINLGPRHPAIKASMVAGVSKTNAEHLLPIGLSVLGGKDNGALEVAHCVDFLHSHINAPPSVVASKLLSDFSEAPSQGEVHLCPGFGNQYGSVDEFTVSLIESVLLPFSSAEPSNSHFIEWGVEFSKQLHQHNMGLLKTGLVAIVCCQLGIASRESIGLCQLICAPGIFAQGVEQTHKPITAMPILDDEQHIYTPNNKENKYD